MAVTAVDTTRSSVEQGAIVVVGPIPAIYSYCRQIEQLIDDLKSV